MSLRYYVIDAFAERPFTGNPAAVVPLDTWPSEAWLQAVAAEMNLAETAFTVPRGDEFELRWFTPKIEVDLCGHATLAAAAALREGGLVSRDATSIAFHTRSGRLLASFAGGEIELDFPVEEPSPCEAPEGLLAALGSEAVAVARNRFDYLVELSSANCVRRLSPNMMLLERIESRGIMVTARSDEPRFDFISRFFAPRAGISEDPVTGSAHCALAPYWESKLGKSRFTAYQASSRGGIVRASRRGNRVILGGEAIVVAEGCLRVPPE